MRNKSQRNLAVGLAMASYRHRVTRRRLHSRFSAM